MESAVKRRARAQPEGEQEAAYSGRLLLRMPPALHADLARLAEEREVSLNQLITTLLGDGVSSEPGASPERAEAVSPRLTRIALAVNIAVVAFAGLLAVGLLVVALSDAV
jgi:hypothetical protein